MTENEIYDVIEMWLNEPFEGGRHQRRIEKLDN
jgi:ribose 5-phosphate isomerase RpiB